MADKENQKEEENLSAEVDELLEQGLGQKEITARGYSPSLVRQRIRKRVKAGKGLSASSGEATGDFYPVKIGKSEIIPPEQALDHIRLQDGDYKLGFCDGMGVLIMAARYNQLLAASQAEVLSNQLKIMEESRKGSADVAQEAAARAAASVGAQIMPEVQALKNQIMAQGPNPMAGLMMSMMGPAFQQAGQQLAQFFGASLGQPQPSEPQGNDQQPSGVTEYRREADGSYWKSVGGGQWQKIEDEAELNQVKEHYEGDQG